MPKARKTSFLSARAARDLGLDFEIAIYERSLDFEPNDADVLDSLGHAYTAHGQYDKGLEIDKRLTRLDPENHVYAYNLACSLSLLGRIDEAFEALDRAVALGFNDLRLLAADPDLKAVRTDPRFLRLVEKATKSLSQ